QQSAFAPPGMLLLDHADGTVVSSNAFNSSVDTSIAVLIASSANVSIDTNNITLTGANTTGIQVQNLDNINVFGTSDVSATLLGNTINTGGGVGIVTLKAPGYNLTVGVAGNDLNQNLVGLAVHGDGTNLGNVDAGSIGGSPGFNHFEAFTNTGPGENKAI